MDKVLRISLNSLLDGILRQIDGTQPLDYNTSKKHVNLDLPIQFSDQYGNLSSVRNNNICMYSDSLTIKLK